MSLENFAQLEEKINKALEIISRLRQERDSLKQANQELQGRLSELDADVNRLRGENEELRAKANTSSIPPEVEQEIAGKISDYIGRIDNILGTEQ